MSSLSLWEVLVPTVSNKGKPFRTRHHRAWDEQVRRIAGGLTVLSAARGQWLSPEGDLFSERMLPVRIVCTRKQFEEIVRRTIKHYDQIAVLGYRISDEVVLRYAKKAALPFSEALST